MPIRYLDEKYQAGNDFFTIEVERVVRGNQKTGRRPYIHYQGVEYRNDVLADNFLLVGKKVKLIINVEDIRNLKAYLPDGSEIEILKGKGKWGIRKHSLKMRKAINSLYSHGELKYYADEDPIEVYHNYLKKKSKNDKNSRNKLASLERDNRANKEQKLSETLNSLDIPEESLPENVANFTEKMKRTLNSKRERLFFNN